MELMEVMFVQAMMKIMGMIQKKKRERKLLL
jgi:hypothetical protein